MKKIGILLIFLVGTISLAFSQKKSEKKSKAENPSYPHQLLLNAPSKLKVSDSLRLNSTAKTPRFSKPLQYNSGLKLKAPETLLLDSTHVFVPRSLYTERLLTLPKETKFRVGLPLVELPDPQSRMPIRDFDDSVNYTMLKKEY